MANIISKQLAEEVSCSLTKKLKEKIEIIRNDLKDYVRMEYMNSLPIKVKEFHESEYKGFLKGTNRIIVFGVGIVAYGDGVYVKVSVPYRDGCNLQLKDSKKYLNFKTEIEKLESELVELKDEIRLALLNLKTYKNIREKFPDAYKLIDISANKEQNLPAINLSDLIFKLKTI